MQDVAHSLTNGLRINAIGKVVSDLPLAAPLGFTNSSSHGLGHLVGIHHYLTIDISSGTTDHLNERCFATQESFFVGIENTNKRHLGKV